MNNEQPNIPYPHQSSDSHSSTMEEKLPEQIMESVLLEGVNSQELLQNTDIVNFSNILANLRYDLSSILNEDIDEFTFQTICQDLLSKTSENIKLKPQSTNKSQSQQPKPIQNQIDIDDIYAHLKRQPWQYNNSNDSVEVKESKYDNEPTESNVTTTGSTAGSSGWNSYLSQVCNHDKQNNISNDVEPEPAIEMEPEMEPGNIALETPNHKPIDNEQFIDNNAKITLMGDGNNDNNTVKFKRISGCYQEIFNENIDNMINDIHDNGIHETDGNGDNDMNKSDKSDDDDDDSLIDSNITLMGHETIQ